MPIVLPEPSLPSVRVGTGFATGEITVVGTGELQAKWLEPHPDHPHDPAAWRIKARRVGGRQLPILGILQQFALKKSVDAQDPWDFLLHLGADDPLVTVIADDHDVPAEAIRAVVAYSSDHREDIAKRLRSARSAEAG